jgi:formylglycine-generating enzyme required for sulfatase activity
VIVCLSRTSINKTGFVNKEIRFALDAADEQPEGKVFIIPTRLEDCPVPERLSKWQWVNLYAPNGYEKLLRGLRKCARDQGIEILLSPINIGGMQFMPVPAGSFLMGSRDDNPDAFDDEKAQHTLELPNYYMARLPVTNQQFSEFLDESKIQHTWVGDWKRKSDHPVVNVTWHDAVAFCRWFSEKHQAELPAGMALALPSEAEWEKAARGEFGREYPWGDSFDPALCNTYEGGKGDTTPAGAYSSAGDSPYGCADMAGNVWEWTRSLDRPYPYQPGGERENLAAGASGARVLRGGSWHSNRNHARCAFRGRDAHYSSNVSVRLVLAPNCI